MVLISSLAVTLMSDAAFNVFGGAFAGILLLSLLLAIVHIVALVQCATANFSDSTNKLVWILVILFLPLIGTVLWFTIGKSSTTTRGR